MGTQEKILNIRAMFNKLRMLDLKLKERCLSCSNVNSIIYAIDNQREYLSLTQESTEYK